MSFVRRAATAIVGTASAVALTIGLVPLATAEDAVAAAQAELTQLQTEAAQVERDLQTSKQEQVTAQRQYDVTTADLTDDGIAVLFEQYGTRGFTADQFPGADRFALVGGIVYGASDSGVTAIDATSGRVTGTSPSAAPTAVTSNGVALAQSSDGYTAFKVIPHF